jgi:hypothetical protein
MKDQETWPPAWDDTAAAPALQGWLLRYVQRSTPWGLYWVAVIERTGENAGEVVEVWLEARLARAFTLARVKPGEHVSLEVAERRDRGCPHDRYVLGVRRGGGVHWVEAVDGEARWVNSTPPEAAADGRGLIGRVLLGGAAGG